MTLLPIVTLLKVGSSNELYSYEWFLPKYTLSNGVLLNTFDPNDNISSPSSIVNSFNPLQP